MAFYCLSSKHSTAIGKLPSLYCKFQLEEKIFSMLKDVTESKEFEEQVKRDPQNAK